MCSLEIALMLKILLNTFCLCHPPNVNERHESGRCMIEISGFSDMKYDMLYDNRWNRMQAINNEYSVCLCKHYFISPTSQNIKTSLHRHFSLLMFNESICLETKLLLY